MEADLHHFAMPSLIYAQLDTAAEEAMEAVELSSFAMLKGIALQEHLGHPARHAVLALTVQPEHLCALRAHLGCGPARAPHPVTPAPPISILTRRRALARPARPTRRRVRARHRPRHPRALALRA